MKAYKLTWEDKKGNVIASKVYHFDRIKEARSHAALLLAECNNSDVARIRASRSR